jgi:DNA-binding MarR family transcriptional regulator
MENRVVLEHFVDYLQSLNRYLRSAAFDENKQTITRVQWLLLRQLHRSGGKTIGQLAAHLDVRASTMSQMIDRMEKMKYVVRHNCREDARVKMVKLTSVGTTLITQMEAAWIESLAEPFNHFNMEEKQQLVHLMAKLANHLPRKGE